MYLRKPGTKSPHDAGKSGAILRIATVNLLFYCALMAGAVSADDYYVNNTGGGTRSSETDPSNLSSVLTEIEGKTGGTHTITLLADTYSFQQSGGATNYLYINQSADKNIVLRRPPSGEAVIKGQFVYVVIRRNPRRAL